ncbi:hypothetical protein [Arthrobacter sp. AZCC_0090]|uniref:hypothetical protein n=1 Tax=Arthrobacter sp. AZCC_0090 TaxID=2735881 RepID=UPI0017BE1364|nr:hypothetical protein [Arthrobacter sp. AZCC_0090]MBB6403884.1 hypothetical protein [Arthrobacter sp. AZCC_0090]
MKNFARTAARGWLGVKAPGWALPGWALPAGAVLLAALLCSCSVNVPDPAARQPESSKPVLATPTITPGHDARAVAAKDMPLQAGGTLAAGVPVGISDGLRDVPGWHIVRDNVQGESRFDRKDGCVVSTRVSVDQGPLAVPGDDQASTEALFTYLDPAILPSYLRTETLGWGSENDKPASNVEVMAFNPQPGTGGKATSILARLFGTAGSSVYISFSCRSAEALSTAKADVAAHLPLVPPSN